MFPWFQNSLKFSGKVGSRIITIDCRIWPDWSASMAIPFNHDHWPALALTSEKCILQ